MVIIRCIFFLLLGSPLRFSLFLISPSLLAPDKVEQAITFPPCKTIIFIHLSRLSPSPSLLQSLFFSSDYHLPSSPSLANLLFGFTSITASPLHLLFFFLPFSPFFSDHFQLLPLTQSAISACDCQLCPSDLITTGPFFLVRSASSPSPSIVASFVLFLSLRSCCCCCHSPWMIAPIYLSRGSPLVILTTWNLWAAASHQRLAARR